MLETFKQNLQEKIENNTYKSKMTWTDKGGNSHTEEVLLKRSRLPIFGDWARIYPPIDEHGNINKINLLFGGKKNLIKLVCVVAIVGLFMLGYYEAYSNYYTIINNMCVQNCMNLIP